MAEPILFPTVEPVVVAYLRAHMGLAPGEIGTELAPNIPDRFVRVTRVGGNRKDIVTDSAMVTVQCWGPDANGKQSAAGDGAVARAYLFALDGTERDGVWFRAVKEIGGLGYFPDPRTGRPVYQFTAQLHVKGAPL